MKINSHFVNAKMFNSVKTRVNEITKLLKKE